MAVFGLLQINDPDPALWVAIYAIAAVVFFAATAGHTHRAVTLGVMVLMAILALRAAPGTFAWAFEHNFESITGSMSDDKPWIEETREFLGLAIALGCLGVLALWPPSESTKTR